MSATLGSLCSGYGGLDLAVASLLDMRLLWVSDIEPAARRVLGMRFPDTPNIGDLRLATPEPVDVLTAGFPCQPVSHAGKQKGTDDDRWLWQDIEAFVGRMEPRPRLLLLENVAGLLSANDGDAMARVISGLAHLGYVGSWRVVRASDVGAPRQRARVFIVAHTQGFGWERDGITRRRWTGPEDGGGDAAAVTGVQPEEPPVGRLRPATRNGAQWGAYEPAVRRWERVLGRPAPPPTAANTASGVYKVESKGDGGESPMVGTGVGSGLGDYRGRTAKGVRVVGRGTGATRLNPVFVEWMMGLPAGWVTDTGIPRTAQLRVLGNGVVPQQAAFAYRTLLNAII